MASSLPTARSSMRSSSSGRPASRRRAFFTTSTGSKPTRSISSSCGKPCKPPAMTIFLPLGIAPPVHGRNEKPSYRRVRRPRTSRRRTWQNNCREILAGQPIQPWYYRDFGSLVSLGEYSTVGSLMGKLVGRSFFVEGYFARLMYVSLYKMHEYALHGFIKVALDTLVRLITRRTEPQVKLH